MRFGLVLPSFSFADLDYGKAAQLRDFATEAEARNHESLWVVDHLLTACGLYGTAWLSPIEPLSFVAGCTPACRCASAAGASTRSSASSSSNGDGPASRARIEVVNIISTML